jgi:protein-S-isoprenylcysteine O-methyltransferase Ste14
MSDTTAERRAVGANVRLVPPLVYAVPLLLLWLLDRAVPLRMPDGAARAVVGWVLVVGGITLTLSAAATFRRKGTTLLPHHAVSTFVTSEAYRFTRNPMYVGMTVAYLGGCLVIGSWWPLLGLPVIVVVIDRLVIVREETYLHSRFGADYAAFCARRRRWI